jgi:hypothetical protein
MNTTGTIESTSSGVELVPVQVHYPTLAAQRAHQLAEAKAAHRLERTVHGRLASPHLGYPTARQLSHLHEALTAKVHHEIVQGATVHQRLPRLVRAISPAVALLDFVVLFSFCAGIFNLPPAHPWTPKTPIAVMLALLGSGVAYTWLSVTGRALRGYRTPMGEIGWAATGRTTRLMLGVSVAVTVALSALMFTRVAAEATVSHQVTATAAQLLGLVFGVLSAAANLAVIAVHALDGSDDAAQVRRTGKLLHRWERRSGSAALIATRREVGAQPRSTDPVTDTGLGSPTGRDAALHALPEAREAEPA